MQTDSIYTNFPAIIITGMHRSGTSLTASLLQSSGINIGNQLMPGNFSNVKGHFENLDFVSFHETALQNQGISREGWVSQGEVECSTCLVDRAKSLISQSSTPPYWGWKDPRTVLYLDFWKRLIPQAKFLFVYRSPWEVIDSLYRRGDHAFHSAPIQALRVWLYYNSKIIDFYRRNLDSCLLARIDDIASRPEQFIKMINNKFDLSLEEPRRDIYEDSLLSKPLLLVHRKKLIQLHFPDSYRLFSQLEHLSDSAQGRIGNFHAGFSDDSLEQEYHQEDWILHDWMLTHKTTRQSEQNYQSLSELLEASKAQVHSLETKLKGSQVQNQELKQSLEASKAQVHSLETKLKGSQVQNQELIQESIDLKEELSNQRVLNHESSQKLSELQNLVEVTSKQMTVAEENYSEVADNLTRLLQSLKDLETDKMLLEQELKEFSKCKRQLEQSQALVHAMESSKFWKIRSMWFKLKELFEKNKE